VCIYRVAQIFQKSGSHLKILGVIRMTWSKAHTDDQQILGATVHIVVDVVTWYPGFVHPCVCVYVVCQEESATLQEDIV